MPPVAHIALALVHALVAVLAAGLVFGVSIVFEEPAGIWLGALVLIATIGAGAASQARFADELRDAGGALTGKPFEQAAAAVSLYRTRVAGGRMALEEALSPENIAADNEDLPEEIREALRALPSGDTVLAQSIARSRVIVGETSVR
ncbi:MAG: hypothetical protein AAF684_11710, partial [Pseudomonadota bacterium]